MSDIYEYKDISEKSKQFAVDHLNENPLQVNAHIVSFRRWVTSMPHLKCPTDSNFLLRFLRVAKFDHKKAEKRLDNFCTVRSSPRGSPEYFSQINIDDPIIDRFLDSLMLIPLGRSEVGELIFFFRLKQWNPDQITPNQMATMFFMLIGMVVTEEDTQIHGIRILTDMADVSRKTVAALSDPKFIKNNLRILQDCFPTSIKGLVFFNESTLFNIFFTIMLFFMNEKLKKRVLRLKNDIDKGEEKIPGLKKILPTEYGGFGGSMSSIWANLKEKFKKFYKNGHPLADISVDDSKRSPESMIFLTDYGEYEGEIFGIDGTYTK